MLEPNDIAAIVFLAIIWIVVFILILRRDKKIKKRKLEMQRLEATKKINKPLPPVEVNTPTSLPQDFVNPQVNAADQTEFSEPFEIHTQRIDPDEGVPTPPGAEISYLDAKALRFWDKKRTNYIIPPYYVESAFGRNVKPALQRLLDGGYLELSGIEKNIGLKTVPELKSILAERELKTSGNKPELIARLMDNFDLDELEELFPVGVYSITERGQNALEPYDIIRLNNEYRFDFSYYRLFEMQKEFPTYSNEDILVKLLTLEIQKCYKDFWFCQCGH